MNLSENAALLIPSVGETNSEFVWPKNIEEGGQHNTVVAFALSKPQTQLPRVRILAFPNFFLRKIVDVAEVN